MKLRFVFPLIFLSLMLFGQDSRAQQFEIDGFTVKIFWEIQGEKNADFWIPGKWSTLQSGEC